MDQASNFSLACTDANKERTQEAYSALDLLLRTALVREWSGKLVLELTVKRGTIVAVEDALRHSQMWH